jgi:hypothetical protein
MAIMCLCAAASDMRVAAQWPGQNRQPPPSAPSLKTPEKKVEVPPTREHRRYDSARDATYVNVDITLVKPVRNSLAPDASDKKKHKKQSESARPPPAFAGREVTLTFQLAYSGKTTYDLKSVYLIIESTDKPEQPERLSALKQVEVKADAYVFDYDRVSYRTETVALTDAPADTPPVRKEIIVFAVPPDDLSQIANANSLMLKLGAEQYTVKSPQLTELRSTLVNGED